MSNKEIILISLIGRPGSGKSTVGKILSKNTGYPFFSAGDLFRKVANENSERGEIVKHIILNRLLTPPEVALPIMIDEIKKLSKISGIIIMDGYPRNLGQLAIVRKIRNKIKFVNVLVSEEVCKRRIANATDRGDRLDDKNKKIMEQGFTTYTNETTPMIEEVRRNDSENFIEIQGDKVAEDVSEDIRLWINSQIT